MVVLVPDWASESMEPNIEVDEAVSPPLLSVMIPTRNRAAKVRRAVESILANSFRDFELIVVDQSTDRSTEQALAAIDDPRLRYIPTDTVGAAVSRNIGIRASHADTLVFTDDDCVCDREWLASIVAEYAAEPTALGIYGRVIPYGPPRAGMICPCINESTERLVLDGPAIPAHTVGNGNNMSFRREVFRRVGLFIEALGPGTPIGHGEDTEFAYRVLWSRCKLIYSPEPVVQHDRWLDETGFTKLMRESVRGLAAVFLSYALRYDRFAFTHLLRLAYYLSGNRLSTGSARAGLAYFVTGLLKGPKFRLLRPPPLELSMAE
ncbi:MAG TPA: glycosyltransferase family A protein [Reyranella sp.]|jgi:glycosyltransferase involved in cell wall biosynthesis|nr:glycosyltransferase family A protein [Reyranella sp.]